MKYPKEFYTSAKEKKASSNKATKAETARATAPAQRIVANLPEEQSYCDRITGSVDRYIRSKCEDKANSMTSANEAGECSCATNSASGGASSGVDLVVLIDSSGSMGTAGNTISQVAPTALERAVESCNANANVTYLYLDNNDNGVTSGPWLGIFTQSHESYLVNVAGASSPFLADGDGPEDNEQGGKAIADISNHFNWTPGFCRAILYVGDDRLDSTSKSMNESRAAADLAISTANANNVVIFSHFMDNGQVPASERSQVGQHYQDMSEQTGGHAQLDMSPTVVTDALYIDLISRAICGGCGEPSCTTAELPELEPCVSISWGDSECDCMEGDDHEEICISICNCYDNVTFQNVKIGAIVITDEDGRRPPRLPDGSPSTELYPVGPYCFGDIGPCKDGEKNCVTRNAMIINRGLPPGTWKVRIIGLCFDVTHHYDENVQEFEFTVCKN